jgi:hypothetical protein
LIGARVFGLAALAFGIITLVWPEGPVVVYAGAAAQILGGAALQFARTAKAGALVTGAVYLIMALQFVPAIVAKPLVFDGWGNFFEQFSLASGAALVYASASPQWPQQAVRRIGRILVGVCAVSFALYQAFYFSYTASLVPTWLPPNQMFWSVATTVLFALAAGALLTNRLALLAARLQTLMLVIFGLLVWLPALVTDPRSGGNWSEAVTTFAIAATSWILAEVLG